MTQRLLGTNDLFHLNMLCYTYHTGCGYIHDKANDQDEESVLALNADVSYVTKYETNDDDYCATYDLDKVRVFAEEYTVPHQVVKSVLSINGESSWERKPGNVKRTCFDKVDVVTEAQPWYQLPARQQLLGSITERPYVLIINPYEEMQISAKIKQSAISLDDILFASRGLSCGPDRSYERFTVLQDDGITLKLKVDIDNWST